MNNSEPGRQFPATAQPHAAQEEVAQRPVVLVTAGDADFALPLTVALHSALSKLDRSRDVFAYVIDDGISPKDKARSLAALEGAHPRAKVEWLRPDLSLISGLQGGEWHSRAMYLRLLIPQLLPDHERVLYFDGDVVVRGDLSTLFSIDMQGRAVMAVENFAEPTLATGMPRLFAHLNAPEDAGYFNSGVLLLDLPRWREQRIAERTVQFLQTHKEGIKYGDQDALNGVLAGDWGHLDPRFNVQLFTIRHFGPADLAEAERTTAQDQLLREAAILHYVGWRKPWQFRYPGRAGSEFLDAAARSGWFKRTGSLWRASRSSAHVAFSLAGWGKRKFKGLK